MLTYSVWLSVAGTDEGADEIAALNEPGLVARYLADWRLFCETVGEATSGPVIAHNEPGLWGLGQQLRADHDLDLVAHA